MSLLSVCLISVACAVVYCVGIPICYHKFDRLIPMHRWHEQERVFFTFIWPAVIIAWAIVTVIYWVICFAVTIGYMLLTKDGKELVRAVNEELSSPS